MTASLLPTPIVRILLLILLLYCTRNCQQQWLKSKTWNDIEISILLLYYEVLVVVVIIPAVRIRVKLLHNRRRSMVRISVHDYEWCFFFFLRKKSNRTHLPRGKLILTQKCSGDE